MNEAVVSVDRMLLKKWRQGLRGTVHSVHSRAIYLRDDRGGMFCLTTTDEANGPEIARLDPVAFGRFIKSLRQGDLFFTTTKCIWIGATQLNYMNCDIWHVALPVFPPQAGLAESLVLVKSILAGYGRDGGLKYLFHRPHSQDITSATLCSRAEHLLVTLKQQQFSELEACGLSLLGLGGGLTPSGDDFLAALITMFNLPHGPFPEECREIGKSWAVAAEAATTFAGTFLLRIAAQGRAREPICSFVASLSGGNPDTIKKTALDVLLFGSTSGTDWLAGLAAGMEAGQAHISVEGGRKWRT